MFDDVKPEWKEVSQAYFLSWPLQMQYSYCMRRDLDSAESADTPEEKQFFLQRAQDYKQLVDATQSL